MGRASGHARMLGELLLASHRTTLEQLPALVTEQAARAGWSEVVVYVADLQQNLLSPVTSTGPHTRLEPGRREPDATHPLPPESEPEPQAEGGGILPVEGTVPGRAFQLGEILPAAPGDGACWWVPLLDGSERVGVLRVVAPGDLRADDGQAMRELRELAALIAMLLLSKRVTSDSYDHLVRRRRMRVAAEMEWRQMPPRTFATEHVMISALMEPAYEASGDVFDYAFSGETLNLSIFDAMGHDTTAGLIANLAVSTGRNIRRQGADIVRTAEGIEQVIAEQFGDAAFATGILADLDLTTGVFSWISRGHPPPVIIRDGRYVVRLECPPGPPMGVDFDLEVSACRDQLQRGDRLLLYTDGMTEARRPGGEEFGLERFTDFLVRHHADGLPVPETLRRLIRHHLDYHGGHLDDDATVLVLEWHGPTPYPPQDAAALVGLPDDGAAVAPYTSPAR